MLRSRLRADYGRRPRPSDGSRQDDGGSTTGRPIDPYGVAFFYPAVGGWSISLVKFLSKFRGNPLVRLPNPSKRSFDQLAQRISGGFEIAGHTRRPVLSSGTYARSFLLPNGERQARNGTD